MQVDGPSHGTDQAAHVPARSGQQRHLSAFAVQPHSEGPVQIDIGDAQVRCLLRSRATVVQEGQQCPVAQRQGPLGGQRGQQRFELDPVQEPEDSLASELLECQARDRLAQLLCGVDQEQPERVTVTANGMGSQPVLALQAVLEERPHQVTDARHETPYGRAKSWKRRSASASRSAVIVR